jgi:HAD superfamily hydrolase (TIGR01450 family)
MQEKIKKIHHIAMDMDGTIYQGSKLFPETIPFLKLLKKLNIGYTFLTNNSSKSASDYVEKLRDMGINISSEQIINSTINTAHYLKTNCPGFKRLYVVGTDSLRKELNDYGFEVTDENPEVVITGFDTALAYDRLCKAAYWIKQGRLWISTHPDVECPTDLDTVLIDCGAVTACLESVCGCRAVVLGKPNPIMLDVVSQRSETPIENIAMIGDRLQTDIRLAKSSGAIGVHISPAPVKGNDGIADITVRNLAELGELLFQRVEHLSL